MGCSHNCSYCFAKWYCKQDEVRVKVNAPEVFKTELQKRIAKHKPKEPVCLGSISDPYQSTERKYQLTRKMLEVCDELSYPVFIVTKSDLAVRDKDVLSSLAKRNLVAVNFTITPIKAKLLRKMEPRAPPNHKRLEALKTLTQAGVPCNLYLSPILPILSHKYINTIIEKAAENGAKCCSAIFLKMRAGIWTEVKQFLQTNAPSLIKEYEELYFKSGSKDLSGYSLPELDYRFKTMKSIAGMCKLNNICFTSEEFLDLWTNKNSDCVDIDSWHAPTAVDIAEFIHCQDATNVNVEEVIGYIKKHFVTDKKWEKLMREYWDKAKLLI